VPPSPTQITRRSAEKGRAFIARNNNFRFAIRWNLQEDRR
jgi:hypothetical protein